MNDPFSLHTNSSRAPATRRPFGLHRPLEPQQEAQILDRVEERLVQDHLAPPATQRFSLRSLVAPVAQHSLLRSLVAPGLAGFALALLIWGAWRLFSVPPPAFQIQGMVAQKGSPSTTRRPSFDFEVPFGQRGRVTVLSRWILQAEGTSTFSLSPPGTSQLVRLRRGFLQVEVVPGRVKKFEVQSQQLRLVVRGTSFSVERERDWLRLEVWRGAVALVSPHKKTLVRAGQGVRVSLSSHHSNSYSLPSSQQKPQARLRWLAQHQPHLLQRYALDLSQSRRFSQRQRATFLHLAADLQRQRRQWKLAVALLRALSRLDLAAGESENALFEAAQLCRRQLPASQQPLCLSLYRRYLARFPRTVWAEHSLYWLAAGLLASPTSPQKNRATQEATRLLQRYLKRYPKGHYHSQVSHLLARTLLQHGKGCPDVRRLLPSTFTPKTWLLQRCPPWRPLPPPQHESTR